MNLKIRILISLIFVINFGKFSKNDFFPLDAYVMLWPTLTKILEQFLTPVSLLICCATTHRTYFF